MLFYPGPNIIKIEVQELLHVTWKCLKNILRVSKTPSQPVFVQIQQWKHQNSFNEAEWRRFGLFIVNFEQVL